MLSAKEASFCMVAFLEKTSLTKVGPYECWIKYGAVKEESLSWEKFLPSLS